MTISRTQAPRVRPRRTPGVICSIALGTVARAAMVFVLSACATTKPPAPQALRQEAQARRLAGDEPGAAVLYAQLVCETTDPRDGAALARSWADMWDAAGRTGSALGALRQCDLPSPLRLYIDALQAGTHWAKADTLLAEGEALADLSPAWRAEFALRRATVALHQGQAAGAFAALDRAQAAAPERVDIYLLAAQARLSQRAYGEAVATLRPLLKLAPTDVELERARQIVAVAVEESMPPMSAADNAAVRDLLGLLTQETLSDGDVDQAIHLAEARQTPRLMTVAGLVAFKQGDANRGLALLSTAQEAAPLDPDPPRLIGLHYVADNMPDAALGPLVEASQRNPFDPEIQVAIAQLAAAVGDLKLARATYATLAVLRPDVPMFQEERDRLAAQK